MKKAILGALCALLAATMACSIFVGGPAYPEETIPTATGTPVTLQEQLQQALSSVTETGDISFQVTEGQMTSYLAAKTAQQTDPVITDPRVYLRSGEMKVYGKAHSGIFDANVGMTVQVSVDTEGKPHFDIVQTDFGPVAAPQALNDALSAFIQETFTGWLGPVAIGFRLESITIGDGVMTVTGRIK
jgi:hypothetical protein